MGKEWGGGLAVQSACLSIGSLKLQGEDGGGTGPLPALALRLPELGGGSREGGGAQKKAAGRLTTADTHGQHVNTN